MSTEIERIKKLVQQDLIVDAVELPPNHHKKPLIADDIEEVLTRFDDDADYAHFIVRVKRSNRFDSEISKNQIGPLDSRESPVSLDSMVNETLQMGDKITENRGVSKDREDSYEPLFLIQNAKILEENGDFELARNIYEALIKKGMAMPQALSGMARTYERVGLLPDAIKYYEEAIAYASELTFYQNLVAIQIRAGLDKDAIETLIRALGLADLNPKIKFDFHKSLGNCYTRLQQLDKAEYHFLKAYEIEPNSDALHVNVGSLALQKGDTESAKKHFQKALEINKKNDRAISGLGLLFLKTANGSPGLHQKAHDFFVASLNINISNLTTLFNLVKCAYELKNFREASKLMKQYVASHPANSSILYSYAGILYHQAEYELAAIEIQKILTQTPNHSGANELKELVRAKLSK